MNRTAHLRKLLEPHKTRTSIHCTGPYAYFGREGEVSYTAYASISNEAKQEICDKIQAERDDVDRAYITRRDGNCGGNIKVIYRTRADGSQA